MFPLLLNCSILYSADGLNPHEKHTITVLYKLYYCDVDFEVIHVILLKDIPH
jgi:hypothetical protein